MNVHAQKIEVRFADTDAIWQIINAAVREALAKTGSVPMMDFEAEDLIDIPVATTDVIYQMPKATTCDNYNPFAADSDSSDTRPLKSAFTDTSHDFINRTSEMDFAMPSMPSSSSDDFEIFESEPTDQYLELESAIDTSISAVHYIGRKFASMMVGGVLAVFDLTRARERILFDRYSALLDGGKSVSQQLLFPQTLTLSEAEYSLIEEWAVDFAALGFDISLQSGCTVNINGIPAELSAYVTYRQEKDEELLKFLVLFS